MRSTRRRSKYRGNWTADEGQGERTGWRVCVSYSAVNILLQRAILHHLHVYLSQKLSDGYHVVLEEQVVQGTRMQELWSDLLACSIVADRPLRLLSAPNANENTMSIKDGERIQHHRSAIWFVKSPR